MELLYSYSPNFKPAWKPTTWSKRQTWLTVASWHMPKYGKAQLELLPVWHIKQDGSKSQETKRRPEQVTSPLTQLGACFLASRKSFAMGGTMQDVCGEPGVAGGQTAERFFSKWLLLPLGKCTDILAPCQMKSGYIPLHVTSPQVISEHSGPSTNWKHWGNHADLFLALPQMIQAGNHWSLSIF